MAEAKLFSLAAAHLGIPARTSILPGPVERPTRHDWSSSTLLLRLLCAQVTLSPGESGVKLSKTAYTSLFHCLQEASSYYASPW